MPRYKLFSSMIEQIVLRMVDRSEAKKFLRKLVKKKRRQGEEFPKNYPTSNDIDRIVMRFFIEDYPHVFYDRKTGESQSGWHILGMEHAQNIYGNHLLLPDSAELVEALYRAKFNITADSFALPFKYFSFAFPADYTFKGQQLPGVLVSMTTAQEAAANMFRFMDDWYRLPDKLAAEISHCDRTFLSIMYHRGFTKGSGGPARCEMDVQDIPQALESPEGMARAIGTWRESGGKDYDVSEEEAALQHAILRIVCAFSVYIRAFPDHLVDGLPECTSRNITVARKGLRPPLPHTIARPPRKPGSSKRMSVSAIKDGFFRTGHFRTLRDERYTRAKDGKPRIIWVDGHDVKPSIVGKPAKVHTVISETEHEQETA